jgi:glycosyltransferase involved in cell wall biosynthesis
MQQHGLGERLLSMPTLPANELGGIYNAADLLLLPSRHENFGNVVIEALACGCAVAISDRTGVAGDLLGAAPADYGIVLPRRSRSWTDWLNGWLCQPLPTTRAVTSWVADHYSQKAVAHQAIELYQRILQTRMQP